MKKWVGVILSLAMMTMIFTSCGKDEAANSSNGDASEAYVDQFAKPEKGDTVAEIVVRDYGTISIHFFNEAAPKAVENFITHAKDGYYDGLTFHRIIEDFMIQGGDPTGTGSGGESIWGGTFEDEFYDYLQPYRGALCMANSGEDTNGSQFFIVQATQTHKEDVLSQIESQYGVTFDDTAKANYAKIGGTPWLYKMHTVFGQVYEGYEVLDAIAQVEKADEQQGIPATEVIIDKINIKEY